MCAPRTDQMRGTNPGVRTVLRRGAINAVRRANASFKEPTAREYLEANSSRADSKAIKCAHVLKHRVVPATTEAPAGSAAHQLRVDAGRIEREQDIVNPAREPTIGRNKAHAPDAIQIHG